MTEQWKAFNLTVCSLVIALSSCGSPPEQEAPPKPKPPAASTQGTCDIEKFSAEEKRGFKALFVFAAAEKTCKEATGKYASFEQLASKGCKGGGQEVTIEEFTESNPDPRRDPNYEFRLVVTGNGKGLELSQTPRRAGLAGFFSNGEEIYCNATGPASTRNKLLGKTEDIFEQVVKGKIRLP